MAAPVKSGEAPSPVASARRPDIQGLRAIAVLVVVAFHAGLPVPGGFVGVDVFFVISGYVITEMLQREQAGVGRIDFGSFYLRRFKRLTPALALMVAVTLVLSVVILAPGMPQEVAARTGAGAMLLIANAVIAFAKADYFGPESDLNPLLNTWSLSVEEQFYLVFPALLVLGWLLARRRVRSGPLLVVGIVAAVSFALAVIGSLGLPFASSTPDYLMGFFSPLSRAWEFAAGALLALLGLRLRSRRLASALGLAGLLLLGASLWLITEATPFPGLWTLLPVAATMLLLLAGTSAGAATSRALATRPMVKVGDWSYSIYLWHWPFIVFAALLWPDRPLVLVAAAAASFIPALASYRFVEQPIRGMSGLSRRRWTALILATVLPPLAIAGIVGLGASRGWGIERIQTFQAATVDHHLGYDAGCAQRAPLSAELMAACGWNTGAPGQPIYLIGDSNADHFSEAVVAAGRELGRPVYIATGSACRFIDRDLPDAKSGSDRETCRRFVQESLDYLRTAQPGLVIIANRYPYRDGGGAAAPEQLPSLEKGLTRTVRTLLQSGQQVVLVQSAPDWLGTDRSTPLWDPNRCSMAVVLAGECVATQPLDAALATMASNRATVAKVASDTGVPLWDFAEELCPAGICSTEGPGYLRYADATHISVPQSAALAPILVDLLRIP